jgi:sulfate adenylyltransferase subunit 1
MDLVDYQETIFQKIRKDFESFSSKLDITDIRFIPISALNGDNVVNCSKKMSWYEGSTLLYTLENLHIGSDYNHIDCRFPVQTIIRPKTASYHDFRGYAGRIAGGVFKPGDEITVLPSGFTSKIKSIETFNGPLSEAFAPMSVTIQLTDDIGVSRGDMLVRSHNQPNLNQDIEIMMCWLDNKAPNPKSKYIIKHTTSEAKAIIKNIRYKLDVNTLHRNIENLNIGMNDVARVQLRTTKPLLTDAYRKNRTTGSIILIDESTHETVAAGMII